jgi:hypothetical protein
VRANSIFSFRSIFVTGTVSRLRLPEREGLNLDACMQQLHVVTPQGVLVGWNTVAHLARLFPATWLIGALQRRGVC